MGIWEISILGACALLCVALWGAVVIRRADTSPPPVHTPEIPDISGLENRLSKLELWRADHEGDCQSILKRANARFARASALREEIEGGEEIEGQDLEAVQTQLPITEPGNGGVVPLTLDQIRDKARQRRGR